ncbi:MAG: ATP-dependent helicase [Deferrisomatales bacterium]|nr:ATP-dependent helicase [Deferrisomatales bacterium]
MMALDLDMLNENQRKAVEWPEGPLLVLAGPGSGKTLVLTLRVARLLQENDNAAVLALTFTNKAAAEMRERVDRLLGQHGDRAQVCTFHAFATDVLRQHGSHLGIQPDFSLLTQEEDRVALVEEIVRDLAEEDHVLPTDHRNTLSLLDRLFASSYEGGAEAPSLVHTPGWVPELFAEYCQRLTKENRLDFGALLHFARKLLTSFPAVTRVLRAGWTHVCVDEFQDTNRAQYDLLRLMVTENNPNLFVVADDDQIIYQWNGASPERLQALKHDYQMEVLQLPENYRCPREIIDLANQLIQHNRLRTAEKQPLVTNRPAGMDEGVIRLGTYDQPEDEAAAIAADIRDRTLNAQEVAVLARTTKLLDRAAEALRSAGIEAHVTQRKAEFETPLVRVVFHALRLANSRHDRDVLRRLCVAWEALTDQALELGDVTAAAALVGGDFLRAWADAATADTAEGGKALVERLRSSLVDRLEFPGVVDWFLAEGAKALTDANDQALAVELETWRELHGELVREHGEDALTLNVYLQLMDLAPKAPRAGPNAVRCMTVHGAKGLEFKHVYLIGMAQEVFPSFQALRKGPASREVEEERRNCFVAITRVQETLTLTWARSYYGYRKAASQFLSEMGLGVAQ